MAEIEPRKQKYLASRFPETIIFQDVGDTARNCAPTADGGSAKVPKAD